MKSGKGISSNFVYVEATAKGVLYKKVFLKISLKFRKIQRKIPVPESLF